MKYLIAIDSDGTLRHDDGSITKRTKNIINKLTKDNLVVLATARPRYHSIEVCNNSMCSKYLISSNGSEVYDVYKNKLIWSAKISKTYIEQIYKFAKINDLRAIFVTGNQEYATKYIRNGNQILLTDENFNKMVNIDIIQIMIIGTNVEKINYIRKLIENETKLKILDSSSKGSNEIWFSIVNEKSSKGTAILKLINYLGINVENIITIGNDFNDIPMFDIADISVAVNNAEDEIKNICNIIIESNNEDGVAKFLEKLDK